MCHIFVNLAHVRLSPFHATHRRKLPCCVALNVSKSAPNFCVVKATPFCGGLHLTMQAKHTYPNENEPHTCFFCQKHFCKV